MSPVYFLASLAITYDDFDVFCINNGVVLSYLLGQVDNYPSPSVPVKLDLDCEDDLNFVPVGENPAPDHDISSFSTPPNDLRKSSMHTCKEISDLDPSFDLTPSHVPNKCEFLDPSCTMNPMDKMETCQVVHQKDVPPLDLDIEDKDNLNITGVTTTCSFNSEDAKSVSSVFDPDNEDKGIVNTRDTTIYFLLLMVIPILWMILFFLVNILLKPVMFSLILTHVPLTSLSKILLRM